MSSKPNRFGQNKIKSLNQSISFNNSVEDLNQNSSEETFNFRDNQFFQRNALTSNAEQSKKMSSRSSTISNSNKPKKSLTFHNQNILNKYQNETEVIDYNENDDYNQKISNIAEPTYSNYDRDDSLYDALSLGMQTPFRLDYVNFDADSDLANQQNSTQDRYLSNGINSEPHKSQRFSLTDLDSGKNRRKFSDKFTKQNSTLDEILLIAEQNGKRSSRSPSKIPTPVNTRSPRSKSKIGLNTSSTQKDDSLSKLPLQKSNLVRSVSKSNLNEIKQDSTNELEYFSEFKRPDKTPSPNKTRNEKSSSNINLLVNDSFSNEIADIINFENSLENFIAPLKDNEEEVSAKKYPNKEKS